MAYRPRTADKALLSILNTMGGALVTGPRGCGKTSTALQLASSSVRMDQSPELVQLAELNPAMLMDGPTPRLIDEWQLAPGLWNVIRHEIDNRQQPGQFILSGSSTPAEDVARHSGAGRIGRLRMRTMSLAESGVSSGEVSLSSLRSAATVSAKSTVTYTHLAEQAVRGGWPGVLSLSTANAVEFNRSYCEDLCSTDVEGAVGVRHEPARLRRLLQSLARNISGEATLQSLAVDVAGDGAAMDPKTVARYLDSLERVFAYEALSAWTVNIRSRARLRTSPKHHLADPSLACALLGVGAERLAGDPEFFGQIFESMAIRDLWALVAAESGRVYHYRDSTGLEVDAVLEYPDGTWAAIEVKLGASRVPEAERALLTLRDSRVDVARVGNPSFMAVITATEFAYTLPSGVHVIPLAVLGA